jgi:hypothetical protein
MCEIAWRHVSRAPSWESGSHGAVQCGQASSELSSGVRRPLGIADEHHSPRGLVVSHSILNGYGLALRYRTEALIHVQSRKPGTADEEDRVSWFGEFLGRPCASTWLFNTPHAPGPEMA